MNIVCKLLFKKNNQTDVVLLSISYYWKAKKQQQKTKNKYNGWEQVKEQDSLAPIEIFLFKIDLILTCTLFPIETATLTF